MKTYIVSLFYLWKFIDCKLMHEDEFIRTVDPVQFSI